MPSSPLPPPASEGADPPLYQVQHSGKQALHLAYGQHHRADPVDGGGGDSTKKVGMGDLALSIIYHMAGENCDLPPSPLCLWPPRHLWQVRELALKSQECESCPCPSPAAALGRTVPATHMDNTVELVLMV